jgi:hypothetical protein
MENDRLKITIEPELQIGTEFWIMRNNKPELGLICSYEISVTSYTDRNKTWYDQLFGRWLNDSVVNNKQREQFEITFQYRGMLDRGRSNYRVDEKDGAWWLHDYRMYFSLDEMKKLIFNTKP